MVSSGARLAKEGHFGIQGEFLLAELEFVFCDSRHVPDGSGCAPSVRIGTARLMSKATRGMPPLSADDQWPHDLVQTTGQRGIANVSAAALGGDFRLACGKIRLGLVRDSENGATSDPLMGRNSVTMRSEVGATCRKFARFSQENIGSHEKTTVM